MEKTENPPMEVQAPAAPQVPVMPQAHVMVTPLDSLSNMAATVLCPSCHRTANTRIDRKLSDQGKMWAAFLCICVGCLCAWIPCVMDDCKDTKHFCSCCNVLLATVNKDGEVILAGAARGGAAQVVQVDPKQ